MAINLWGDEFEIPDTRETAQKIKARLKAKEQKTDEQKLKSRIVDTHEKLEIITQNVNKILGTYSDNTQIIREEQDLVSYIDAAIAANVIAIDTETNNSLDPTTCKLMGLCIYTPGQKSAYVPVNHVDPRTRVKLDNQITEEFIGKQLERLKDTFIIMHNSSFDYQVLGFTTGTWLHVDWDTMTGAKILNEDEPAGLKYQYVNKIDSSIEKYSINSFFENIEYALVDPPVFALYAATDAYMTYKLYLYQKEVYSYPVNQKLYNLFKNVEMPIAHVAADMERRGICIDIDYAKKLADFYHKKLADIDKKVAEELERLAPKILEWKLTPEANFKPPKKKATKSGETHDKSLNEKLSDPIDLSSPTQLAILIYDILKYPSVDKKTPRSTGEDALKKLTTMGFPLGEAMLEKRGMDKILNTFVEAIPAQVSPRDGRLHAHFNVLGTSTGRFSSSSPNL